MANWRAVKKMENKFNSPLYNAYTEGAAAGIYREPKRNRYPRGRRHDEYESGYAEGMSQPQEFPDYARCWSRSA